MQHLNASQYTLRAEELKWIACLNTAVTTEFAII